MSHLQVSNNYFENLVTLYYGFNRYKSLFVESTEDNIKKKVIMVNPNAIKYIMFIDIGHSKTSFILSEFRPTFFRVVNCLFDPFLGGRDFDLIIFEHLNKWFIGKYKVDINEYTKSKIRLLEQITKARKILTANQEANISVDSLVEDYDFSYLLTRNEMLEIIKPLTNKFQGLFEGFFKISVDSLDKQISFIEMAGDCMRMPILQNIVTEISKKELSKSIIIDECVSKGCALYSAFMTDNCLKSIPMFKGVYHWNPYTILYSLDDKISNILINKAEPLPAPKLINLGLENLHQESLLLDLYYSKNEVCEILGEQSKICGWEFDLIQIFKANSKLANCETTSIEILVDNAGKIHLKGIKTGENQFLLKKEFVKLIPGILKTTDVEEEFINTYKNLEKEHLEKDHYIKNVYHKRNQFESELYKLGEQIDLHKSEEEALSGRNLFQRLESLDESVKKGEKVDEKIARIEKALFPKIPEEKIIQEKKEKEEVKKHEQKLTQKTKEEKETPMQSKTEYKQKTPIEQKKSYPSNKIKVERKNEDENINTINQQEKLDFSEFNRLIKYWADYINREYAGILRGRRSKHSVPNLKSMHEIVNKYNNIANQVKTEQHLNMLYDNLQREMQRYNVL
jgi:molecular chaperone DnaK (HSP70)